MAAQVNKEECTGCSACVDVCPVDSHPYSRGRASRRLTKRIGMGEMDEV